MNGMMCAACGDELRAAGTRYVLTIRTASGGDEVAFCALACRTAWTDRRPRQPERGSRPARAKAA